MPQIPGQTASRSWARQHAKRRPGQSGPVGSDNVLAESAQSGGNDGRKGIEVDHSSVHRWMIKLVPLFEKAFRKCKRAVGRSWRMDETYVKVKGNGNTCTAVPRRRPGR
ncbi:hypothetical protein QF001_001639 [Paraburkholderia youngii]